MFITIKYSCKECGLVQREVIVPARQGEDIMTYLNKTLGELIQADHWEVSPNCLAKSVQDLMIPVHQNIVGKEPDDSATPTA